jgi:hypothetical protein
MMITEEYKTAISTDEIRDLFMHLELKSGYSSTSKTLQELYDAHTQFISYINEWQQLYNFLKSEDEVDYVNYMNHLQRSNPSIFNNLNLYGISFDEHCKTIDVFIEKQKESAATFPFSNEEIVAWDTDNFILKDNIYYEITGNHMIFFLSRLS